MRKIILSMIMCILVSSLVLAQGPQGIHEPGTGVQYPEVKEAGQGTGQGLETNTETETQNIGEEPQIQEQAQADNPKAGEQVVAQEQVQERTKARTGNYMTEKGEELQVQEKANNRMQLRTGDASAETAMEMTQEQTQAGTKMQVKLSNGRNAEVKVMPDTASERALERLRLKVCSAENGCSIELKEVGQGEQARAAYEMQAERHAKLLGLFGTKMKVQAQVDAENGEVIKTMKPWWAFLASEPEE